MNIGLTALFLAVFPAAEAPVELRYTGHIAPVSRDGEAGEAIKRFSLFCLEMSEADGTRRIGFSVDERGAGSWPWAARFGDFRMSSEGAAQGAAPRLLCEHEKVWNALALPRPYFEPVSKLALGAKWVGDDGRDSFSVHPKTVRQRSRDCFRVEVTNTFGRTREYWVETATGRVVEYRARIFMGMGDAFELQMQLESAEPVPESIRARTVEAFESLLKLQAALKREPDDTGAELTDAQLDAAEAALPALAAAAQDTPWSRLVSVAQRDVLQQRQRNDKVVQLAAKFVGEAAPGFELNLLDGGGTSGAAEREGKITVLHFWEYQGEPLVEPYGQVGYLDYMHSRRRKLGVQIYGVAVDARFGDKAQSAAAGRSVGRLKSFMNLGFPIAGDDGTVLGKFGDPRTLNAKLPLWIVIDHKGKVAHYSVGYFKINPDEGLKELDEVVVKLIQAREADKKEAPPK